MRSGLGWRYNVCSSPQTLRLCYSHDKRVAGEPPFEHISDPETVRTGITPKRARDPSFWYLSTAYISTLNRHGIEISLAKRGCPWENGYVERLIRTLKEEEVDLNEYEDITQTRARIGLRNALIRR